MSEIRSYIDIDTLRSRSTVMPYPHIKICDLNKCVPIVVSALEEGDTPLLGTLKGITKIVKNISKSALNISKLLRVTSILVVLSETDSLEVTTTIEYMEVAQKWI